jgi:predicted Zn-dependent protease
MTSRYALKLFASLLVLAMLSPPPAGGITTREEEKLSREFMKAVAEQVRFVRDYQIESYVNQIGGQILQVLPAQPFRYRFFVIEEDSYNAFAGPGGVIFIHSGLIAAMESEDELAGIIAHEIMHVYCRHISDRMERSKQIGAVSLAGMVAALALGMAGAGAAANAAMVSSMAAGQQLSLAYSREDEMQADQTGLPYLATAGYDAEGLVAILRKIKSKRWFGPKEVPTYLMTHPAVEERIAYIGGWAESHKPAAGTRNAAQDRRFQRIKARLIALYGDEEAALMQFSSRLKSDPGDGAAHYGLGLLLARSGKRQQALTHLQAALGKNALDPHLLVDLGRVYFIEGQYPQALEALDSALTIAPQDPDGRFYRGRTLLEMGRLPEATAAFEALLSDRPRYPDANYFLASTYSKQDRAADAHYYLGRHYFEKQDYRKAVVQLQKALELGIDPDRKKAARELLAQINETLAELKSAKRAE